MTEFLSKCHPGDLIALVSIIGGLICGSIVLVANYWRAIRQAEIDAKLKQDMLDRGMTPEEIRVVIEAGSKSSDA